MQQRVEPVGVRGAEMRSQQEGDAPLFSATADLPHESADLFDLLDARASARAWTPAKAQPDASPRVDSDDLITTLHERYYEALGSFHALDTGMWISPLTSAAQIDIPGPLEHHLTRAEDRSISGLFSEARRLEDAIGPLVADPMLDWTDSSAARAPEILQLFAPPEYHANAAARAKSAAPTLARREHHTLAIDSPLPALNAAAMPLNHKVSTQ